MFGNKPELDEKVGAVYGLFDAARRGDVVTHAAIRPIVDKAPHEYPWDHVVNRARSRLLRERNIATWPELGVGYKLLTVTEQLDIPSRRLRRSARQARRSRHALRALPDSELTTNQRRLRLALLAETRRAEVGIRKHLSNVRTTLLEETAPSPIRRRANPQNEQHQVDNTLFTQA